MTNECNYQIDGHLIAVKHIQREGAKNTVIFLHDSLGCIELWRNFPELAFPNHNILIYDRRGYGQSSAMSNTTRPLDYLATEADFLIHLMHQFEIHQPILFGHSDGGTIALLAAAKYPTAIKAIFTEGAHIYAEDITFQGIKDAKTAFSTTNLKEKLEKYHGANTQYVFEAWVNTWLQPEFKNWNISALLPQIICPAFIVQGIDDEFGSEQQVLDIMQNINSTIKQSYLIPNAQHTPHKENKAAFLEIIPCALKTFE